MPICYDGLKSLQRFKICFQVCTSGLQKHITWPKKSGQGKQEDESMVKSINFGKGKVHT